MRINCWSHLLSPLTKRTPPGIPLVALTAAALLLSLACASSGGQPPQSDPATWYDVTDEAVQTFYQNGVPHTDWSGKVTTVYQEGRSFFPRGMYYPELCRTRAWIAWEPFDGSWDADGDGENDWDGSYQLRIALADVPSAASSDDFSQRALVHDRRYRSTQALPRELPADEELRWTVLPNPWRSYPGDPIAEGTMNLDCPSAAEGEADDPNVVATLKEAGFNLALPIRRNHPQPFINLMERAGGEGFKLVVDAGAGDSDRAFPEELFRPPAEGGQGYSQHPDIYGWQIDDEPLVRVAVDDGTGLCDPAPLQEALDRLSRIYAKRADATDQVIFHVEAAPQYFIENEGCDPGPYWDASVRIGDVANHDNYLANDTPTLRDIAASMARQTNAVQQAKPSWFTAGTFSYEDAGFPTPSRVRAVVYTAIVHGATGIWFFIWDSFMSRFVADVRLLGVRPDIPERYDETYGISASEELRAQGEALWQSIATLNRELASLEAALLSPTAGSGAYRVLVSDPASQVRTMLKRAPDGEYVLIAVNMDTVATDVRFDFSGTLAEAEVLFEGGRAVERTGSSISDRLGSIDDASAVHVYRLRFSDSDFRP